MPTSTRPVYRLPEDEKEPARELIESMESIAVRAIDLALRGRHEESRAASDPLLDLIAEMTEAQARQLLLGVVTRLAAGVLAARFLEGDRG